MKTEILTQKRTPLDHLISEALYQVRKTLAVFRDSVLLTGDGRRHQALQKLLAQEGYDLPEVEKATKEQVVVSARPRPPECSGTPFGRRVGEQEGPLVIYPLADWNKQAVDAFLGEQNEFCRPRELRKLCVVGESDTGKSELIAGLTEDDRPAREERAIPRYLWTDSRLLILRETRGQHASDLAIVAAAHEPAGSFQCFGEGKGLSAGDRKMLQALCRRAMGHIPAAGTW